MANLFLQRVLALDLRSSRFGYVVYEGPNDLLDWGIRKYGAKKRLLKRVLLRLHSFLMPSVILVRKAAARDEKDRREIRSAYRMLRTFGKRVVISVHSVNEPSRRRFFFSEGKLNKHDIARMVSDRFPELSWRLPPKRKPWQSEPTRQSIFDAASLGVFYFAQQANGRETAIPLLG